MKYLIPDKILFANSHCAVSSFSSLKLIIDQSVTREGRMDRSCTIFVRIDIYCTNTFKSESLFHKFSRLLSLNLISKCDSRVDFSSSN